jgi:putative transferase (TIGR04331 family)
MKNLQLTNINLSSKKNNNKFFLGSWCLQDIDYDKKKQFVLPYHWKSLKKQDKDYNYLSNLHDRILKKLTHSLNKIHKKNYDIKSWGIILEPLLQYYIMIFFDRWEIIRKAHLNKRKYQINFYKIKNINFNDLDSFVYLVDSDIWNQSLFQDIINFQYKNKNKIINNKKTIKYNKLKDINLKNLSQRIKNIIFNLCNKILSNFTKSNCFFFAEHSFDFKNYIRLNLLLKQLPVQNNSLFNYDESKIFKKKNTKIRNELFKKFKLNNNFEKFLINSLKKDIPLSIVENFDLLLLEALKIKQNPRFILSGGMQWHNQLFKHWTAEKTAQGSKFIALEHGGSFPYKYPYFYFEEKNSYKFITWFKEYHANQKQLPAQKILRYKTLDKYKYVPKYCSLVADRFFRYSFDITQPVSGNYFLAMNNIYNFYNKLNLSIKKNFEIKIHPGDKIKKVWIPKRFLEYKFKKNVLSKSPNIENTILTSKILICFYPETTFAESMKIGVPTLLHICPKIYKTHSISKNLFNNLKKANIVFDDLDLLASHVNNIWENPFKWWNSREIKKQRKLFEKVALGINEEAPIYKWKDFLNKLKLQNDTRKN